MTRTLRRLASAAATLLVCLLLVQVTAPATTASWTDGATFSATATARDWSTGNSCEIVSDASREVVGSCEVSAVSVVHEWGDPGPDGDVLNGGMVFTVDVDGYQGAEGTSARITVDLSRVTGTTRSWPWAEGTVRMYDGVVDSWDAPRVTFTTHEWHPSPFQGQFTVGA